MMNIKELKTKQDLHTYDQLSELAKVKAREEMLQSDLHYLKKEIEAFKSKVKDNIHFGVNDRYHVPYFINRKNHINRTINDLVYCEKYILGNLCHFLPDGTYITYSL